MVQLTPLPPSSPTIRELEKRDSLFFSPYRNVEMGFTFFLRVDRGDGDRSDAGPSPFSFFLLSWKIGCEIFLLLSLHGSFLERRRAGSNSPPLFLLAARPRRGFSFLLLRKQLHSPELNARIRDPFLKQ